MLIFILYFTFPNNKLSNLCKFNYQ